MNPAIISISRLGGMSGHVVLTSRDFPSRPALASGPASIHVTKRSRASTSAIPEFDGRANDRVERTSSAQCQCSGRGRRKQPDVGTCTKIHSLVSGFQ